MMESYQSHEQFVIFRNKGDGEKIVGKVEALVKAPLTSYKRLEILICFPKIMEETRFL